MSKKTVRKAPGNREASQRKTKGLIAKGKKTGQSVQDPCVLDNLSHRTPQRLPARPPCRALRSEFIERRRQLSCYGAVASENPTEPTPLSFNLAQPPQAPPVTKLEEVAPRRIPTPLDYPPQP